MAKQPLNFTEGETNLLNAALEQAIASAKRGQNTAKQPDFKELYEKSEKTLRALQAKING